MKNEIINGFYELNPNIYDKNKLTIISGDFCTYKTMLSLHLFNELTKSGKNVLYITQYKLKQIINKIFKLESKSDEIDKTLITTQWTKRSGRLLKTNFNITKIDLIEILKNYNNLDLIIIDLDELQLNNEFDLNDLMDINNSTKTPILFIKNSVKYDINKLNLFYLSNIQVDPHLKQYLEVHYNNDLIAILDIGKSNFEPTFITVDINKFA
jgi:hypothetical protein